MQMMEHNRTKEKSSFRSVQFDVTVGRFPKNYSYPFRPKMDFQAERFKLLGFRSVPLKNSNQTLRSTGKRKSQSYKRFKADSYFTRHPASGKLFLASGIQCTASGIQCPASSNLASGKLPDRMTIHTSSSAGKAE
uniref:Uncharacterized protein n=1 Tax=Romanomermis culicivorax TaxID=13658 RepID=A0A915KND6_ROMCU